MQKVQISNRQLWFILFMIRTTIILAFLPVLTSADAFQDAWISAIITLVASELFVVLISLLNTKFPKLTVIEYSQKLLGKWLGKLFSLIFLWIFLQLAVIEIRIYGEVLQTVFLPKTPMLFITGSMVLASTICVYLGVETLARSADTLFFIFITILAVLIYIPLSEINLQFIQPVFARGLKPIIVSAVTPTALISQIWVLSMITPITEKPKKTIITATTSIGLSLIILIIITFLVLTILGPFTGQTSTFPVLSLIRSVKFSEFLQRTEVIIMYGWGFGLFISVSAYLYSGAMAVAQWFKLSDYKHLVWPMSVMWVLMAKQGFENIFILNKFLAPKFFSIYSLVILVFPLFTLWTAYFIRKILNKLGGN